MLTSSGALQVTREPLQVSKAKKNNPVDIFKKEDFSPQPPHFWGKDGQGIEVWEKATTGELKQEDPLGGYHNNLSEKGWQLRRAQWQWWRDWDMYRQHQQDPIVD